jgi:hypothetical protein
MDRIALRNPDVQRTLAMADVVRAGGAILLALIAGVRPR